MKKIFRNQKGFTLIEMLIVVSIIAILITIAVASYNAAIEKTKEVVCISNIRTIQRAVTYYEILNTDPPPSLKDLQPDYLKSNFDFTCPTTHKKYIYNLENREVRCTTAGHKS